MARSGSRFDETIADRAPESTAGQHDAQAISAGCDKLRWKNKQERISYLPNQSGLARIIRGTTEGHRAIPDDGKPCQTTRAPQLGRGIRRWLHRRVGGGVGAHKRRNRRATDAAARERRISQGTSPCVQAHHPKHIKQPALKLPTTRCRHPRRKGLRVTGARRGNALGANVGNAATAST